MKEIKVGLVGISGYAGMELARLLARHPAMRLVCACSRAEAGKKLGDFYPFLRSVPGSNVEISVFDAETCAKACDVVFLGVPAGTAMKMAPDLLAHGAKVVDLSADFRIHDASIYEDWYKFTHCCREILPRAVYGCQNCMRPKLRAQVLWPIPVVIQHQLFLAFTRRSRII